MSPMQTRRRFLRTLSLAGAAIVLEMPQLPGAEDALETTTVRLAKNAGVCMAPQYVAEQLLLRAEGFAEPRYDGSFTDRDAFAAETPSELPYKWREYDADATARFYARRLKEAGLLKSSLQKIIADGTDWRFLNEVRDELGA